VSFGSRGAPPTSDHEGRMYSCIDALIDPGLAAGDSPGSGVKSYKPMNSRPFSGACYTGFKTVALFPEWSEFERFVLSHFRNG
jgi:hypothetical protein